jgi:hypothetical protein
MLGQMWCSSTMPAQTSSRIQPVIMSVADPYESAHLGICEQSLAVVAGGRQQFTNSDTFSTALVLSNVHQWPGAYAQHAEPGRTPS